MFFACGCRIVVKAIVRTIIMVINFERISIIAVIWGVILISRVFTPRARAGFFNPHVFVVR